jgi:EAL domain-containing protein (putative c-di-GMP-specific phosphodiesterase class I)
LPHRTVGERAAAPDFGTGYSSLSYVRRLDVDSVKIDGHALGLTMVAEGVEDAQQERFLRDAGCELAQGRLFGRPAPLVARGPSHSAPASSVSGTT